MIHVVAGGYGWKQCGDNIPDDDDKWGNNIPDDKWFIQATAHAQKVMGVSMKIMSHAVEGLP